MTILIKINPKKLENLSKLAINHPSIHLPTLPTRSLQTTLHIPFILFRILWVTFIGYSIHKINVKMWLVCRLTSMIIVPRPSLNFWMSCGFRLYILFFIFNDDVVDECTENWWLFILHSILGNGSSFFFKDEKLMGSSSTKEVFKFNFNKFSILSQNFCINLCTQCLNRKVSPISLTTFILILLQVLHVTQYRINNRLKISMF